MKRFATLCLAALTLVWGAAAQGDEWELTETLDIPQAEFSFNYPEGYTLTAAEDGYAIAPGWEPVRDASVPMEAPTPVSYAYVITELASDAALAMDADWATDPEGTVITLLASPLADWQVDETMSVVDISMSVADILGMSTFARTPVAVMGRMGVLCDGFILSEGRSGVNVIWTDDGSVFVLGLETAGSQALGELDDEIEALLATFQSTPVAPLDRDVELGTSGYIVSVPSDWTLEQTAAGFALSQPSDTPTDGMDFAFARVSEAIMRANSAELETTDDAIRFMVMAFDFAEPSFAEVLVAGEATLELSGRIPDNNAFVRATAYMLGEDMMSFLQFAPDAESLERYEATYHAILASVRLAPDE